MRTGETNGYTFFLYLISKKYVGKKFRQQKNSSVINIRHLDKNSSLFTDEIFCRAIYETYIDNDIVFVSNSPLIFVFDHKVSL